MQYMKELSNLTKTGVNEEGIALVKAFIDSIE